MKKLSRANMRDFVWNAIGLTFNSFNSLFFLIAVRYINGMDEAGIFTYAFSLCCLFYVFACFFNRTFQITNESKNYSFDNFLSMRLIFSGIALILILGFSLVNGFSPLKIMTITLLMVFRAIEAISECIYGKLQKEDMLYATGISLTIKAILGLSLFILFDYLTKNILFGIVGIIIANIAILIFYDRKVYKKISKDSFVFSTKNVKAIIKISLPVMLFTTFSVYLTNCPKYLMTYFESNETQTIFGILIMPATVISLASSFLINPFVSKLTALLKRKEIDEFKKTAVSIILIMFGIGALAIGVCYLIGIQVLDLIYNLNLLIYKNLLLIAVAAAVFYAISNIISNFLTIIGENRRQTLIYGITSVITTVITLFSMMNAGMEGAIFGYLMGGVLLVIGYMVLFGQEIKKLSQTKLHIEGGKNAYPSIDNNNTGL